MDSKKELLGPNLKLKIEPWVNIWKDEFNGDYFSIFIFHKRKMRLTGKSVGQGPESKAAVTLMSKLRPSDSGDSFPSFLLPAFTIFPGFSCDGGHQGNTGVGWLV